MDGELVLQSISSPDIPTSFGTRSYATLALHAEPDRFVDIDAFLWAGNEGSLRGQLEELTATFFPFADDSLQITLGKQYLPFGIFDKNTLSAPLTESLGSLQADRAVTVTSDFDALAASFYWFEESSAAPTEQEKPQAGGPDGYGLRLERHTDDSDIFIDYVSNLSRSDLFFPNDIKRPIPGLSFSASVNDGAMTFLASHIASLRALEPSQLDGNIEIPVKPSATRIEMDYEITLDQLLVLFWNRAGQSAQIDVLQEIAGIAWQREFTAGISARLEASHTLDAEHVSDWVFGAQISWSL